MRSRLFNITLIFQLQKINRKSPAFCVIFFFRVTHFFYYYFQCDNTIQFLCKLNNGKLCAIRGEYDCYMGIESQILNPVKWTIMDIKLRVKIIFCRIYFYVH